MTTTFIAAFLTSALAVTQASTTAQSGSVNLSVPAYQTVVPSWIDNPASVVVHGSFKDLKDTSMESQETPELTQAARIFRVATYEAFRLDRPEYNRRIAASRRAERAWIATGRSQTQLKNLIAWLDQGTYSADFYQPLPVIPAALARENVAELTPPVVNSGSKSKDLALEDALQRSTPPAPEATDPARNLRKSARTTRQQIRRTESPSLSTELLNRVWSKARGIKTGTTPVTQPTQEAKNPVNTKSASQDQDAEAQRIAAALKRVSASAPITMEETKKNEPTITKDGSQTNATSSKEQQIEKTTTGK